MEQITPINLLLLSAGLLLHILFSLQKVLKSELPFSLGRWVQENWINMLIAIVCAVVSLLLSHDMINAFGFKSEDGSPFYKIHAFVSGYLGRDLIFRAIKSFRSGTK